MGFPYWCYGLHHPQASFVLANQPGYYPGKLGKNRCFGLLIPILVILTLISSPLLAQRGALTTRQSIDQLTDEATLIVHGHVTSAKVEPHPQLTNLMTVLVTMEVQETLKGTPRNTSGTCATSSMRLSTRRIRNCCSCLVLSLSMG